MDGQPVELGLLSPEVLRIAWSDGESRTYAVRELRDKCPCATCREQRKELPAAPDPFAILSPAETLPLRISKMEPVGRYAYAIHFSDGHNTGLYTLEQLRELGEAT